MNFVKHQELENTWVLIHHEYASGTHNSKGTIPDSGGHIHKILSLQHEVFQFACDGTALGILTVLPGKMARRDNSMHYKLHCK